MKILLSSNINIKLNQPQPVEREAKQVTDACKLTYGYKERKKQASIVKPGKKEKIVKKNKEKLQRLKRGCRYL